MAAATEAGFSKPSTTDSNPSVCAQKGAGKFEVQKVDASNTPVLLTDIYALTMAYSYWKSDRHNDSAVFELFFRRNPFRGEYTIFAGLERALHYIKDFHFTEEQVAFVRSIMPPHAENGFFNYLASLDCSRLVVHAMLEGSICFPREPVMVVEGSLALCQLLEGALLNLTNFASLMATNACRFRIAAGPDKQLYEFGLRQAQGPDGAISASRYAYVGGFDGTSNVKAAQLFGVPLRGNFAVATFGHAFVSSFGGLEDLRPKSTTICGTDILPLALKFRSQLNKDSNLGELAAFVCYAASFPKGFLALVDTYDTVRSGIPNFLAVALALDQVGEKAVGVRLDCGDLAYLSRCARQMFTQAARAFDKPDLKKLKIVASNSINEDVLNSLNEQGHECDGFLIGMHLATCQKQAALGMVYKLTELNSKPRMKLAQEGQGRGFGREDLGKLTIPGAKEVYRLIGRDNVPLLDMIIRRGESPPVAGRRVLAQNPFDGKKRVYVTPKTVIPLLTLVWDGTKGGLQVRHPSLEKLRAYCRAQVSIMREDHLRCLNATPYKISVSSSLHVFLHELWNRMVPIPELS